MAGTVQTAQQVNPRFSQFKLLAAGTYDLVALDPGAGTGKRCAVRVVALAADTGWTIEDGNGVITGPFAVPANFDHQGLTRSITCASPIAVYW